MNVQELETARRLGLPFVILVWSDGGYGLIEMHQRRKFGRIAGTRFDNPGPRGRWPARSAWRGSAPRRRATSSPSSPAPSRHPGPVVIDVPIDYGENDKLAVDLWQLAPEALS